MVRLQPSFTLFPYTTLFRSTREVHSQRRSRRRRRRQGRRRLDRGGRGADRKSTRLNSSHLGSSYAVFCLKKKIIRCIGNNKHISSSFKWFNLIIHSLKSNR